MQTSMTSGISSLNASMAQATFARSYARQAGNPARRMCRNKGTDLIDMADRFISIAGGVVLIAAVVYFSPILIAILERLS